MRAKLRRDFLARATSWNLIIIEVSKLIPNDSNQEIKNGAAEEDGRIEREKRRTKQRAFSKRVRSKVLHGYDNLVHCNSSLSPGSIVCIKLHRTAVKERTSDFPGMSRLVLIAIKLGWVCIIEDAEK
jgi:hypothetical protein